MEYLLSFLLLVSFVCVPVGLVSAVVNKFRNKPAGKGLRLTAVSVVVFIAAAVMLPEGPAEERTEYDVQANAAANTETLSNEELSEPESVPVVSDQAVESGVAVVAVESDADAEYIGANLWLKEADEFSEGSAWVQFRESDRKKGSVAASNDAVEAALGDDADRIQYGIEHWDTMVQGNNRAALIDKQGKILWESELTGKDTVLRKKSEFRDGLAYCIFDGNEKSSYMIIDSNGNVTFTRDCDEDYLILGHGGGLFLAAEHTSNFDINEWKIGAIDKNGNIVVPFRTYLKAPAIDRPEPVAPPDQSSMDSAEAEQARAETEAQIHEAYEEWQRLARELNNRAGVDVISEEDKQAVIRAREKYDELLNAREMRNGQAEAYEAYLRDEESYEEFMNDYISFDDWQDYSSSEYLGESIFKLDFLDRYILLNIKTQTVIYVNETRNGSYIEAFMTDFENGAATVLYNDPDGTSVCSLGTDGTITTIVNNDWTQRALGSNDDKTLHDGLIYLNYDGFYQGGGNFPAGAYYNVEGERVLDFPQYRGKRSYQCDPFYSGYAAMSLEGADGLNYITVINKNGDLMFEPKPGFSAVYTSEDGKYVTASKNGHITVFDITGNPVVSIDYVGIVVKNRNTENKYNVCDGMIRVNDFYVNVTDGTVIGLYSKGDAHFSVTVY